MEVLYEDNHLLAVNKPPGMISQPTDHQALDCQTEVRLYLKEKYQKPYGVFIEPLFRLDRPASGILLFAKTSKALSRLMEAIRNRQVHKSYCALLDHDLPDCGYWEDWICHHHYCALITDSEVKGAKKACLEYRVVGRASSIVQVDIHLITGRYHQIRAQFASRSCPLLGDRKYGSCHPFLESDQIALHHKKLIFYHPVTKKEIIIETPIPFSWKPFLTIK